MADNSKIKIQNVVNDLIDRYRLVFWYDESGEMEEFAHTLELPGVDVLTLDNNAFTTKYKILKGTQPERGFIVYCHGARPEDEDNWLLDLEKTGTLFSADMGSLYAAECKIPLELKSKVVDPHLTFFKTTGNRKKLSDRLHQGMTVDVIEKLMMAVICKTEPSYDQLTLALAEEAFEQKTEILDKLDESNLLDKYWEEIETVFGYSKQRQVKDMLIVLFREDMNVHIESAALHNEAHIFMRDWRDSRQYGELYKQWAKLLEDELCIKSDIQGLPLEQLIRIETFPCVDKVIAQYLQMETINETMTVEDMEAIVDEREHKIFFSVAAHTIKALLEARRLMESIGTLMADLRIDSPEDGFRMYQQELYKVDMYYRHYFREAKEAESKILLEEVTKKVERTYTNSYLQELAKKWQPLVDGMTKWEIPGFYTQRRFYDCYVSPFITKGRKVFVIISDALRYETMVEMEQRISQISRMETKMKPAMVSTLPSYTQLGMAALLPNRILSYEKDQDEVFADGISTKGTPNRTKVLNTRVAKSKAYKADDFLAITSPKTEFKDLDLIYIYSNIIDNTGDKLETEHKVFKATEDEFEHIQKIVELIRNGNGSNILVTSDHGYLYQNEQLDESEFTDFKPMGNYFADTRRFIIGTGLQPGNAVKTWNSEDVGLKAGRHIQIAKAMNRLRKQGSGSRFVHGGSMLQEITVPVLHVNIKKTADISQVDVDILNKRAKLTTNNQTINFYQSEPVTEKVKELALKIGFYNADGELISDSVMLTFASQSEESAEREQKHTFIFKNQLSRLNGQEVTLRMEKQIAGSDQFAVYKEFPYKVSVMFQAEF